MWLIGTWILAVGLPFAVWPNRASQIADRLRAQPANRITPRQTRYARSAGIALAALGTVIVLATQLDALRS